MNPKQKPHSDNKLKTTLNNQARIKTTLPIRGQIPRWFLPAILLAALAPQLAADPVFIEAENFTCPSDGWRVMTNSQTRRASAVIALNGAAGPGDALATHPLVVKTPGPRRVWIRYQKHDKWRGPFRFSILNAKKEIAAKTFDLEADPKIDSWEYTWEYLDADLPVGENELCLAKHENRNCSGYVRYIDCILATTNMALIPNHLDYGPQTFLRITLGDGYEKPLYIHVFADHYRAPWYAHYHLSKNGISPGLAPEKKFMLRSGEATPWCNITHMLYQDSGAILNITPRYTYSEKTPRLKATFEFSTAPDSAAVARTITEDREPSGLIFIVPPNLLSTQNLARFTLDREAANATGLRADSFQWPKLGKAPETFPYFVAFSIGGYETQPAAEITERELKTLEYFGFSNSRKHYIHGGIWKMKNESYCNPDVEKMREAAAKKAESFKTNGLSAKDITYAMLMDEPCGQPASFLVKDPDYIREFRAWLQAAGHTPEDLLLENSEAIKPVLETERDTFPALYYYTQKFRTVALGRFLALQRNILAEAYGGDFPTVVNFSDGATYHANFYGQGVDYFELLENNEQNAIWGEDWANISSTYQCSTYNVELMRAAARRNKQTIGHFLIAYAGRTPLDIKLKGVSQVARGVKILKNFFYGCFWGSHESSAWQAKPETWFANAELVREIGWAEDFLVPAMPVQADTAIVYSSSSDIWTLNRNNAAGFERMHTWLALTHAQIPSDFLSERDVADGELDRYKVCYFSGPNLTGAAARKLTAWVKAGGTLWLTAGACARDEYNRPLKFLEDILPVQREPETELQPFLGAGWHIHQLKTNGAVHAGATSMQILSMRQAITPKPDAETEILAVFDDQTPALVRGRIGNGTLYCCGFLPAMHYIKTAEDARNALAAAQPVDIPAPLAPTTGEFIEINPIKRSHNPWEYPSATREFLLQPARFAKLLPPITCSVPLVDAVCMKCDKGLLIPLANYTLVPITNMELSVRAPGKVMKVESAHQGEIPFQQDFATGLTTFSMPLESTDFVKILNP